MSKLSLLKSKIKEVTMQGLPFMEGKEKGELVLGEVVTINNYDYLKDPKKNSEYVVITLKEYPNNFYYAGSVVTDTMLKVDKLISSVEEKLMLLEEGIEVSFDRVQGEDKTKNPYLKLTFL